MGVGAASGKSSIETKKYRSHNRYKMEDGEVKRRWPTLIILTLVYVIGELSHFLLGIVTRPMSQDIHYGTIECLSNTDAQVKHTYEVHCETIGSLPNTNDSACVWDYSGLGLQYQILAGPSFIAVFTVSGIIIGMAADRYSRHHVLTLFLLLLVEQQGLALGIFNWGIYFGYGMSYAVGNFVTQANILNMGWRWSYFISGIYGGVVFILLLLFVKEPERKSENILVHKEAENSDDYKNGVQLKQVKYLEENGNPKLEDITSDQEREKNSYSGCLNIIFGEFGLVRVLRAFFTPSVLMLTFASCIRHTAGYTWGYNTQLYYSTYYPQYNLGIWITIISIIGGACGVAIGGFASDRLMKKLGLRARLYVLTASQPRCGLVVVFAVLLELLPPAIHTTSIAVFLFIINNVGGNAPLLITPLRKAFDYRTAILILYPGCYLL
ncbi:hypothetical protein Anas_04225 [Armadillidium nasatum]|uniref:Uncharacterized protein n=1 Tax=Armadillidium nasatum TaxID=96803 RepID=A0A5N5SWQ3_9CRUS|nr:hypothetical protein Anas_04225 [Armadillidium nasatum]